MQSIVIQPGGSAVNNRVQSINAVSYSYDASGNVTGDGVRSYSYDGEGRQVSVNGGAVSTSVYDSSNRRVKKTAGGVTTHYIWEGSQVIAEYNASTGALISEYIYAGSRMVARDQGGVVRYFHQDRLSTRLITDGNGTVVGTEDHLPFGEDLAVTGESEKHRFTTYERDSESGSDYAINRQHSYSTGRFLQPDIINGTITDPQSLNRFSYVQCDPINLIDSDGRVPFWLVTGLVGATAGAIGSAVGQVASNLINGRGAFDNFSWKAVAVSAGTGFAAGTLGPFATTFTRAATIGGVANTAQYFATQYVNDQPVTPTGIIISAGTGALGGVIAGPINQATLQYVQNPLPWIRDRAFFAKWNNFDNVMANVTVSTLTRNITGSIFTNVVPTSGGMLGRFEPPAINPMPFSFDINIIDLPLDGIFPRQNYVRKNLGVVNVKPDGKGGWTFGPLVPPGKP